MPPDHNSPLPPVESSTSASPTDNVVDDKVVPTTPIPPANSRRTAIGSLWRLRPYLKRHLPILLFLLFAAVAGVVMAISIPLLVQSVVDDVVRAENDPLNEREELLIRLGLAACALGIGEALMIFLRRWVQTTAVLGLETDIRNDLHAHLHKLPMEFHGGWQGGQLLSRATTDLSVIRRFFGFGIIFLITNIVQLCIVVVVMLRTYPLLGLVVAAMAVPIVWQSMRFEKRYIRISRQVQDEQGDLATSIEESALGIRTIKAFGRRHHVFDGFDEGARRVHKVSMDKVRLASKFFTFLDLMPNVTLTLVLLFGALAVGNGDLRTGTLIAFTVLVVQLSWPIASVGHILAMAQESMTAADRLMDVFDTEPSVVGGTKALPGARGHLRFEGVGFHFPDSERPILRDVWLDVAPGETVALVGATGSGKTSLVSLVPRLYDVTAGRITIDGVDVRELTLSALRETVTIAFEEPTLFSMSVRENLALGRPDASEDDITKAIEVAQAKFVYDLPWGLDTRIGEQGLSLSGGQRQRLALARAVVSAPKVLVLDDTLSALDVETEALVEEALRYVLREATGVVVAHRASTVLLADKVALLQDGTISHVGTHAELLASVPAYRELLAQDADQADEEVLR